MIQKCITLCCLFIGLSALGQAITCSPMDKKAFASKIQTVQALPQTEPGAAMVAIGKTFLQTPYVAHTLDLGDTESLVINLRQLDCTTFVENVLALLQLKKNHLGSFDAFTNQLEAIRYRDGIRDGYPSRLHYLTEWIRNNAKKRLIKDVTNAIGGQEVDKPLNFMGTHRDAYPPLKDSTNYARILKMEADLAGETLCVLPQDQIAAQEHLIHSGDIIALATDIKGLDVTHTGIATLEADGRIHLLHASTGSMEVEVSELPLADYLKKIKHNTGIIVARPQ